MKGTLVTQVLHVPSMWVNSCQSLLVGLAQFVRTFVTRVCCAPLSINKCCPKSTSVAWTFKMSSFLEICIFLMPVFSWYDGCIWALCLSLSHLLSLLFHFEKCLPTHSERSICKKSQRPFPNINSVEVLQLVRRQQRSPSSWAASDADLSCLQSQLLKILIKPSVLVIVLLLEDIVKLFCISSKEHDVYWEFLENILCCFGLQCCGLQNWWNCSLDSFLIWSILDEAQPVLSNWLLHGVQPYWVWCSAQG